MGNLFTSAALGWLGRRVLDWGGWVGTIAAGGLALYANMTPTQQDSIGRLLSGNWQEVTLGAIAPLIMLVFSQVMSFRATVKPQVVTSDGKKVGLPELAESTQTIVEASADNAVARRKRKPNLLQILFGKRV